MPLDTSGYDGESIGRLEFADASAAQGGSVTVRVSDWGVVTTGPLSGIERAAFFAALRRKADARLAQFR